MMLIAPNLALAQEDGPIVVGERPALEALRIEEFRAALDLNVRYSSSDTRDRNVTGDGVTVRRKERELEFREMLLLAMRGFAGHPNLAELNLSGSFAPAQRYESRSGFPTEFDASGSESGWTFDTIGQYDASALILKESDAPLLLYSRRSDSVISRPFAPSSDSTVTEHGARLDWRTGFMPSQFHYFHREHDQRTRAGFGLPAADFRLVQDTFQWQGSLATLGPNQDLNWSYTFDNVAQRGPGAARWDFQRHDGNVTHLLRFGERQQHDLRSSLSIFDESGAFNIRRLRLNEQLRLRHTPRFETNYNYTFDHTSRPGIDQAIHRGSAGFRHRLFDSLVTTADVGASRLSISSGDFASTEYFGNLGLNYTKNVPYGRLNASAAFSFNRQEESNRNGTIQIINEPHTFSPAGFVILQRRLIVPGSIIITDAAGVFVYALGIDYTVLPLADRVEIRRIIGGQIAEQETVLISYLVGVEPGHTTDTFGMGFTIRYDFDDGWLRGLGLYARYFQQEQSRSNVDTLLLPANDIHEIVFGADYTIWRLTFLAEHQIHKSTLSPFNATRAEARYTQPLGPGSSISAAATWFDIDRYEDDLRTQIFTLSARWQQQMTERLSLGLYGAWRHERNGDMFDVNAIEQQLDLSWRYRQTTVYGSVRNVFLFSDPRRSHFQTLFAGLRREF